MRINVQSSETWNVGTYPLSQQSFDSADPKSNLIGHNYSVLIAPPKHNPSLTRLRDAQPHPVEMSRNDELSSSASCKLTYSTRYRVERDAVRDFPRSTELDRATAERLFAIACHDL